MKRHGTNEAEYIAPDKPTDFGLFAPRSVQVKTLIKGTAFETQKAALDKGSQGAESSQSKLSPEACWAVTRMIQRLAETGHVFSADIVYEGLPAWCQDAVSQHHQAFGAFFQQAAKAGTITNTRRTVISTRKLANGRAIALWEGKGR